MSKKLKKGIRALEEHLSEIKQESGLNNSEDNFIFALLDIELKKDVNIPDAELQKILNDEGIYEMTDLLALSNEVWSDELGGNKENEQKLEKIKKRIINY